MFPASRSQAAPLCPEGAIPLPRLKVIFQLLAVVPCHTRHTPISALASAVAAWSPLYWATRAKATSSTRIRPVVLLATASGFGTWKEPPPDNPANINQAQERDSRTRHQPLLIYRPCEQYCRKCRQSSYVFHACRSQIPRWRKSGKLDSQTHPTTDPVLARIGGHHGVK